MADPKQVTPAETAELLKAGYVYVDVRTPQEFEAGHPPGALNVPISLATPAGMAPNAEFAEVMQRAFAKSERLVLGCKSGVRSKRALQQLLQAGFSELAEMGAGWEGSRDPFGRPVPGWSKAGLPIETGSPAGQGYDDVKTRSAR